MTYEDELEEQILLDIFSDRQNDVDEIKRYGLLVINEMPQKLICYGCGKKMCRTSKYIIFHDVHEVIRYADMIRWREKKQ